MQPVALPSRPRQSDATRLRLFEAALAEFRRDGFDRVSVARIARRAGVSRPCFYFHFPTKEHVLLELRRSLELELVERLSRCRSLRETLAELVEGLIESELGLGDPDLYRDMLSLYARRPEVLRLDEEPFPILVELEHHFAAAAERGELRAGLEPADATLLCLSCVFGVLVGVRAAPEERRKHLEMLGSLFLEEETT